MAVTVVALGKIGLPLAVQIASKGHQVYGADVNPEVVRLANEGVPWFPGETDLAEYRHRREWFNVSTRQAVSKLWALREMFLYDEPPQLDLPTPQNPLESECRSRFFDWIKRAYPDLNPRAYNERELWRMLNREFLKEHAECAGVELKKDFYYDLWEGKPH